MVIRRCLRIVPDDVNGFHVADVYAFQAHGSAHAQAAGIIKYDRKEIFGVNMPVVPLIRKMSTVM